jgi:hypothetical protein
MARAKMPAPTALVAAPPGSLPQSVPGSATAHPPPSSSVDPGTHACRSSQTNPAAHWSLELHAPTQAPNASSHAKGPQSKGTPAAGQLDRSAEQYAGPTPALRDVQRLGAQTLPVPAVTHFPEPSHVATQLRASPQS